MEEEDVEIDLKMVDDGVHKTVDGLFVKEKNTGKEMVYHDGFLFDDNFVGTLDEAA